MTFDEHFMALALEEAKKSLMEGGWPIGCIIVLNGEVISKAHNTKHLSGNRLEHAEINAINAVISILDQHHQKATIYSTYEPCPLCLGAIVISRIGRVVTGINLDDSGCLKLLDHLPSFWQQPQYQVQHTEGILAAECEQIFRKFKKNS